MGILRGTQECTAGKPVPGMLGRWASSGSPAERGACRGVARAVICPAEAETSTMKRAAIHLSYAVARAIIVVVALVEPAEFDRLVVGLWRTRVNNKTAVCRGVASRCVFPIPPGDTVAEDGLTCSGAGPPATPCLHGAYRSRRFASLCL